jgi:hypothetical protein
MPAGLPKLATPDTCNAALCSFDTNEAYRLLQLLHAVDCFPRGWGGLQGRAGMHVRNARANAALKPRRPAMIATPPPCPFPTGGIYAGYYAAQSAVRYERFWLKVFDKESAAAVPPLDVAFAWCAPSC